MTAVKKASRNPHLVSGVHGLREAAKHNRKAISDEVKRLREGARMNQVAFSRALRVARSLISASESGRKLPTDSVYLRLGKFAASIGQYREAQFFLEAAGLGATELLSVSCHLLRERGVKFSPEQIALAPELNEPPIWISLETASRILEVSTEEILRMVHRGELKGKQISDPVIAEIDFKSVTAWGRSKV